MVACIFSSIVENGIRNKLFWDCFAMHYGTRLTFEQRGDTIYINSKHEEEQDTHIEIDTRQGLVHLYKDNTLMISSRPMELDEPFEEHVSYMMFDKIRASRCEYYNPDINVKSLGNKIIDGFYTMISSIKITNSATAFDTLIQEVKKILSHDEQPQLTGDYLGGLYTHNDKLYGMRISTTKEEGRYDIYLYNASKVEKSRLNLPLDETIEVANEYINEIVTILKSFESNE